MAGRIALIIEDNLQIADIYSATLEMCHYNIEVITNGRVALERLGNFTPDLIILDMNLPEVSGHYIYKEIRAESRLDNTPVIISTANALVAGMLSNDLTSIDRIMVKPVGPKDLIEVVQNL